nr:hypothetical protein CFP56_79534 [Quercus suber]
MPRRRAEPSFGLSADSRGLINDEAANAPAPTAVKAEQSSGLSADSRRLINDEAANARVRWAPRGGEYDATICFEP